MLANYDPMPMSSLAELKRRLRPGRVYRRQDLEKWSTSVDRHLKVLVDEGRLEKVGTGLYLAPRTTRFGKAPAAAETLVRAFLKDDRFLIVSPNAFNGLSVGATQLHNAPVVYNLKRHGRFTLGGRPFEFRKKASVPARLTEEVLMVDLLQSLDRLPEDRETVLPKAMMRLRTMDPGRLSKAARDFGSVRVGKLVDQAFAA